MVDDNSLWALGSWVAAHAKPTKHKAVELHHMWAADKKRCIIWHIIGTEMLIQVLQYLGDWPGFYFIRQKLNEV